MYKKILENREELVKFSLLQPKSLVVVIFDSDLEMGLPMGEEKPNAVITVSIRRRPEKNFALDSSEEIAVLKDPYIYTDQTPETATPEIRRLRRFATAYEVAHNLRGLFKDGSVFVAHTVGNGSRLNVLNEEELISGRARVAQLANRGINVVPMTPKPRRN